MRADDLAIKLARMYRQRRWQYSPRRLRADGVRLDRPIFLLGLPRNGATLIGRCLRRNRGVLTMSGSSDHWTGTDELGAVKSRIRRLPAPFRGNRFRDDVEQMLFGEWQLFACDELLPFYRGRAGGATPDEAAAFRRVLRTVRRKPPTLLRPISEEEQLSLVAQHWANAYEAALEDADRVPNVFAVDSRTSWQILGGSSRRSVVRWSSSSTQRWFPGRRAASGGRPYRRTGSGIRCIPTIVSAR